MFVFLFFVFKVLYRSVAFVFRPRLPVCFVNPVGYNSTFGFAGTGQTYHSAMLMCNIKNLACRIKGNNRLSLDKWAMRNEVDLKAAFDKCDTTNVQNS